MAGDQIPADISTKLDNLLRAVERNTHEIGQVKNQYSALDVAVNRIQTKVLEKATANQFEASGSDPPPPHQSPAHKLKFPDYYGKDDPAIWLHKCEQCFLAYRTPEANKTWTASFYLHETAARWYFRLERNCGVPSWPEFVQAINRRFGPSIRSNPLGELAQLHRTGTVDDFIDQFLTHLARCDDVSERQQTDLFMAGLGGTLQIDVEMQQQVQHPEHLEDAMNLARAYERRSTSIATESRSTWRPPPRGSRSSAAATSPAAQTTTTAPQPRPAPTAASTTPLPPPDPVPSAPPFTRFRRLSAEEMDDRRTRSLCFNCPEKFVPGHNKVCNGKGVCTIEISEDTPLEDDISDEDSELAVEVSMCAMTSLGSTDTFLLETDVAGVPITALVDSGSTHTFMATSTAARLGLSPEPLSGVHIKVANGERLQSSGICRAVRVIISGEPFNIDVFVIPLEGYKLVLGYRWLCSLGSFHWDCARHRLSFWNGGRRVRLVDKGAPSGPRVAASVAAIDYLQLLLDSFADLFEPPYLFHRAAVSTTTSTCCPGQRRWRFGRTDTRSC